MQVAYDSGNLLFADNLAMCISIASERSLWWKMLLGDELGTDSMLKGGFTEVSTLQARIIEFIHYSIQRARG